MSGGAAKLVVSSRATIRQALETMDRLGADEVTVTMMREVEGSTATRLTVAGSTLRRLIAEGQDPGQVIGDVVALIERIPPPTDR